MHWWHHQAAALPHVPPLAAGELVTLMRELRKIHTIPCGGKGLQVQVSSSSLKEINM